MPCTQGELPLVLGPPYPIAAVAAWGPSGKAPAAPILRRLIQHKAIGHHPGSSRGAQVPVLGLVC